MKKTAPLAAAALGIAFGLGPGTGAEARTFNVPGLTAPVRDGSGLPMQGCTAEHAPTMARTAFAPPRIGPCCQTQPAAGCAEFLSTTRMYLPRHPART